METKVPITFTRAHPFKQGEKTSITFDVRFSDYQKHLTGLPVQDAFPYLTDDEREFIISGVPPGEWEYWMGERDD